MGSLRLGLALIIVLVHCTMPQGHAAASNAVFMFFVLSGYGCTAAMATKYQGKPWVFLANRYVRLWPSYLVVFALSSLAWSWTGNLYNIGMPTGLDWLGQLSMLWMPSLRLVPTAWVMPWLFAGYFAIAFGATATPQRTALLLGLTLPWMQHDALTQSGAPYAGQLSVWAFLTVVGAAGYWLVPSVPVGCRWAADIAFPVFLCHYLIMALLMAAGLSFGLSLFWASLPPTLALSWALVVAVERPVSRFRES
jgi:peptidoglycan/LPS O-acetylase OafA/YrhL